MPHSLASLTAHAEQDLSNIIEKFESLSGYRSEDNRLLSHIRTSLRSRLAELDLDPDDTTPKELYHTLLARFEYDSQKFASLFGHPSLANPDKFNKRLINLIELIDPPGETWCLKSKAARDLLRQDPPKKLLKHLKYRSVESMLKREEIGELYAGLRTVESSRWLNNFYHKHTELKPSDFELRPISVLAMPAKRWSAKTGNSVSVSVQAGSVALWPPSGLAGEHKLSFFIEVIHAIEHLRTNSLSLMMQQLRPDFARIVYRLLTQPGDPGIKLDNISVPLGSIQKHYNNLPSAENPLAQEPHMVGFVSKLSNPSRPLALLHPAFAWWNGNELVGATTKSNPVSLNIGDVAKSYKNRAYKFRANANLSSSIRDEIISRYLKYEPVEKQVLKSLESFVQAGKHFATNQNFSQKLQLELQSV